MRCEARRNRWLAVDCIRALFGADPHDHRALVGATILLEALEFVTSDPDDT